MRLRITGWSVACLWLAWPLGAQVPAAGGYADPGACAKCHSQIAESYARTGMGRSFRSVRGGALLPEFDAPPFSHSESGERFTPMKGPGKYALRREAPSGRNALEVAVDYVMGSGDHARSYLHRTADGKLVEFPVSWYAEDGGHWGMSPGYDRPGHQGFSREVPYRCMFCHNGYPEVDARAAEWDGGAVYPPRLPEGIDCQRCHGPGRNHVAAAQAGRSAQVVRAAIVNPARLAPERRMEVCLQCHLEATSAPLPAALMRFGRGAFSYRPGEPLSDFVLYFDHASGAGYDDKFEIVGAAYRFRKSACFQRSGGGLECTTCHDPHQPASREETVEKTHRACRSCHTAGLDRLTEQGRHPAAQGCVSCHMPRRNAEDVIHVSITDHRIVRRPPLATPAKREEIKLPYAGKVALYYPATLPATPENALLIAIAQVKQLSDLPDGLSRLEALLDRVRPSAARPYFEMGEAWLNSGQAGPAIPFFQQAVSRDPQNWRYLYGLGQSQEAAGQGDAAASTYLRAGKLPADQTVVLLGLGNVYADQGNFKLATAALRQALGRNAESAAVQAKLGNVLLRSGDPGGAERALREAVRLGPEVSAVRLNLADVLIAQGKLSDAREELADALQAGPSIEEAQRAWFRTLAATGMVTTARARYQDSLRTQTAPVHVNLGTVMMMQGDSEGALRSYRTAVSLDPASGVGLTNLALALINRGQVVEARQRLEEAVRVSPGLFEAHLHLGELLMTLGDSASGMAHLQRAVESPDPRVRRAAADRLRSKQ